MNKREKEHLLSKIDSIATAKMVKAKHQKPYFDDFVRALAKSGVLLKPVCPADLTEAVAGLGSSFSDGLKLRQVVEAPREFTQAEKRFENDQSFVERKNAPLVAKLNNLRDRSELGVIKDPLAAIKEAEGWKV